MTCTQTSLESEDRQHASRPVGGGTQALSTRKVPPAEDDSYAEGWDMAGFSYDDGDRLVGRASVVLPPEASERLSRIDDRICRLSGTEPLERWTVPSMISAAVLERTGHMRHFPQHITSIRGGEWHSGRVGTDAYLLPAACLHLYPILSNSCNSSRVLTTRATVYRYEDANWDGVVRLWEHTVREFVASGDREFVIGWLERMADDALELAESMASARVIPSTDSFFPSEENSLKAEYQRRTKSKHELRVAIGNAEVAVASFNYHGTHFSRAFGFDRSATVVTGCVGFGLERWLAFAQGL